MAGKSPKGWYLDNITYISHSPQLYNGGYRLTYCKINPPPYGPGKPSYDVTNRKVFYGKTLKEAKEKADKALG